MTPSSFDSIWSESKIELILKIEIVRTKLDQKKSLTNERNKSQEDVNNAEKVMPHGIDGLEAVPVRMDVADHFLGHRVDQLGSWRKSPYLKSVSAAFSRCTFDEKTRKVKHVAVAVAVAVAVGSSVPQVRMTSEPLLPLPTIYTLTE